MLHQLYQELGDFKVLSERLSSAIVENPPVLLRDGNVIAEGFDHELDELRKIRDHAGQFLIDTKFRNVSRQVFLHLRLVITGSAAITLNLPVHRQSRHPSIIFVVRP